MKRTYTSTQARTSFFKILDDVQRPDSHITITSGGEPKAVIMSFEEYDSLTETLEVLSHEDFIKDLREAEEDYKAGRFITHEELVKKLKLKQ